MARAWAPGLHYVYAREAERRVMFRNDADRREYLRLLGATVVRRRWRGLAYCLMDTHAHLLVEVPTGDLADGVAELHRAYAAGVEERHGRRFRASYGSKLVSSGEQLRWTIAYIARDPVKAGLCRSPADWRWSSHGAAARGLAPRWLDRPREPG